VLVPLVGVSATLRGMVLLKMLSLAFLAAARNEQA
jgi:hypothetical protein